jgi:hypothetical protein
MVAKEQQHGTAKFLENCDSFNGGSTGIWAARGAGSAGR